MVATLSDAASFLPEMAAEQRAPDGTVVIILRNAAASLGRVVAVTLAAVVLPAYLTHRLPVDRYAAWVLILQLGAYVSYLDFGIQTGVSKFVAECDARGDWRGAGRQASSGLALMLIAGGLGLILTSILAWQVPRLFSAMPSSFFHEVRVSVVLVGFSLSLSLVCSLYSAVFLGLQRYGIPMAIAAANRAAFTAAAIAIAARGGNLVAMSAGAAVINVATGVAQVVAWQRRAGPVAVSLASAESATVRSMTMYCFYQSVWTVGMLCVSGLDVALVGHYDYGQTAYYAIASMPIGFLSAVIASLLSPIMPASSAMSTRRSAAEMGAVLVTITRYSTVILLLTGLSAIVLGFPLLQLWVGGDYAVHVLPYLRVLMIANIIRNLCAPYATMICGTGRQRAAILTAVAEAIVNVSCSILLARHHGAIGVAAGTFIGSLVSVALHFATTMRLARESISVSLTSLFLKGMLRPLVIAIPSVLLLSKWWTPRALDAKSLVLWGISTMLFAWFFAIGASDRRNLLYLYQRLLPNSHGYSTASTAK